MRPAPGHQTRDVSQHASQGSRSSAFHASRISRAISTVSCGFAYSDSPTASRASVAVGEDMERGGSSRSSRVSKTPERPARRVGCLCESPVSCEGEGQNAPPLGLLSPRLGTRSPPRSSAARRIEVAYALCPAIGPMKEWQKAGVMLVRSAARPLLQVRPRHRGDRAPRVPAVPPPRSLRHRPPSIRRSTRGRVFEEALEGGELRFMSRLTMIRPIGRSGLAIFQSMSSTWVIRVAAPSDSTSYSTLNTASGSSSRHRSRCGGSNSTTCMVNSTGGLPGRGRCITRYWALGPGPSPAICSTDTTFSHQRGSFRASATNSQTCSGVRAMVVAWAIRTGAILASLVLRHRPPSIPRTAGESRSVTPGKTEFRVSGPLAGSCFPWRRS